MVPTVWSSASLQAPSSTTPLSGAQSWPLHLGQPQHIMDPVDSSSSSTWMDHLVLATLQHFVQLCLLCVALGLPFKIATNLPFLANFKQPPVTKSKQGVSEIIH